MKGTRLRGWRLPAALVALLVVAGGAYAAIPDAAGVIHGCYRTSTDDQKGQLRVVEDPANCRNNEQPIQWNERGAQGLPGPAGADGADGADGTDGADGADGVSPTVKQLDVSDASCPGGGAAITDAAGTTAYVCNGATGPAGPAGADGTPFDGTFTSPNGAYSLSVTDAGVLVTGSGSTVRVSSTGIRIESLSQPLSIRAADVDVRSDGGLSAMVATSLSLRAGSTARLEGGAGTTVRGGGVVEIDGGSVALNGGTSCRPAARAGDLVAPSPGNTFPGTIVGGAPSVCIG